MTHSPTPDVGLRVGRSRLPAVPPHTELVKNDRKNGNATASELHIEPLHTPSVPAARSRPRNLSPD